MPTTMIRFGSSPVPFPVGMQVFAYGLRKDYCACGLVKNARSPVCHRDGKRLMMFLRHPLALPIRVP